MDAQTREEIKGCLDKWWGAVVEGPDDFVDSIKFEEMILELDAILDPTLLIPGYALNPLRARRKAEEATGGPLKADGMGSKRAVPVGRPFHLTAAFRRDLWGAARIDPERFEMTLKQPSPNDFDAAEALGQGVSVLFEPTQRRYLFEVINDALGANCTIDWKSNDPGGYDDIQVEKYTRQAALDFVQMLRR